MSLGGDGLTHHENEEDKKNKGGEVDGSEDWVCFLDLGELEVPQDNTKLGEATQAF